MVFKVCVQTTLFAFLQTNLPAVDLNDLDAKTFQVSDTVLVHTPITNPMFKYGADVKDVM